MMADRECTWYSVVITNLPPSVNQHTIRPQVQVTDHKGVPQFRPDNTPVTVYVEDDDMYNVMNLLVQKWATEQTDMRTFRADKKLLYFTNYLKNMLNNNPTCISWHDGDRDVNCQFNGYHIHIMMGITTKGSLCDKYDYKRVKATGQEVGAEIRNQRLLYPDKFLAYMVKPPKWIAGTNSKYLRDMYDVNVRRQAITMPSTSSADEFQMPVTKKAKYEKQSKQSADVVTLKMLMNKYKTSEKYELIKAATESHNVADEQALRNMIRHPNWKKIYLVAVEELDIDNRLNNKIYYRQFMEYQPVIPGRKILSYEDTQKCFLEWCEEQVIDPMRYIISAYLTLTMKLPKRNTLYLYGNSNAGKTYVTSALIPFMHVVGSHITSREFAFQECVTKPVILISELTITTQEQAEVYKQVLAGETILVNIKNRHADVMHRKPVIMTTNTPIWGKVPHETIAFKNRCFVFANLTVSNVIAKYSTKGSMSHHYFQHMFRLLDVHMSTMNIRAEDMLKEATMKELRPIATAFETDTDPTDLYMESDLEDVPAESTNELIVISDADSTDNNEAYEADTEVDSPPLIAVPLPVPVQKETTEPVAGPSNLPDEIRNDDDNGTDQQMEAQANGDRNDNNNGNLVNANNGRICQLCDTCTESIRKLIRGCAKHDASTQTEAVVGNNSPFVWVYKTPEDQRIMNPYTPPPARPPSPRRRLFSEHKPDKADIDMEIAILDVMSPRHEPVTIEKVQRTPLDVLEGPAIEEVSPPYSQNNGGPSRPRYPDVQEQSSPSTYSPLVDYGSTDVYVASREYSPVEQGQRMMSPSVHTDSEPDCYITHL